jgi:hypothetical protein
MYLTILAFDPGQTTGFCEMCINTETGSVALTTANLKSLVDVWTALRMTHIMGMPGLQERPPGEVVVHSESFHLYPHRATAKIGSSFPEVEVIGVIKLGAQLSGWKHIERPASMVKSAKIPSQIKMRGRTLHEKDAVLHALLHVRTILKIRIDFLHFIVV